MALLFLNLTHGLTRALCLMLVHSLWQGFLAAVIAGIIILCTRKSTAALRYNLLMLDLLVFLTLTGFTFSHELAGSGSRIVSGGKVIIEETRMLAGIQMNVPAGAGRSATWMGRVSSFLNRHSSGIVLIWMFCLLGQLVRLTGGLYQLGRLRRYRVFPAGDGWKERMSALMARLGVRKPVELLQSALISVPVTFGFLKPTILVPLGMLANLPADQVETILLHELAHISRNDYLANLLLHITEAVFFFNPGLRWIASLVRDEREACCDDVVIQGAENRNSYFDALVAFRELTMGPQAYGLQLGAGRTDLLWRIRRMLNQENKKLRFMEKAMLSLGLTAILAICLITLRAGDRIPDPHEAARAGAAAVVSGEDTVPATGNAAINKPRVQFPSITTSIDDNGTTKKYKIDATDADGNTFRLTKVNGEVTELVINGKSVPQKDFDQYLYIFEESENRSHLMAGAREDEDGLEAERQEALDKAQKEALDKVQEQTERLMERQDSMKERHDSLLQEQVMEVQEKTAALRQELQEKAAVQQQKLAEQQEKLQEAAKAYEEQALEYQQKAREYAAANEVLQAVISDIIGHGLATNTDQIHSFRLDINGLTVNGEKAAAEVSQEFRDKYLKGGSKDRIVYLRDAAGSLHTEVITGH